MTTPDEAPTPQPTFANLPLWKSFFFGILGAILFGGLIASLLTPMLIDDAEMGETAGMIVSWVVFLLFYLVLMVSLWKCAYNTGKTFLGHLARGYAVLTTLFFIAIAIVNIVESME